MTQEIELTKGIKALVDNGDFEWLNQWKWHTRSGQNTLYVVRRPRDATGRKETVRMHRLIMGVTDPAIEVDHEDGNGLNNHRYNLRVATHRQNLRNVQRHRDNQTGYKGVTLRETGRFAARIGVDYRTVCLGTFDTAQEAAAAYDAAALQYHGEYANVNGVATEAMEGD